LLVIVGFNVGIINNIKSFPSTFFYGLKIYFRRFVN